MSANVRKALLVSVLHIAIVAGLGAKFAVDRATLPRVWVRTDPVDPALPIRGRYVSLRLELAGSDVAVPARPEPQPIAEGRTFTPPPMPVPVSLEIRNQQLVAVAHRSGNVRMTSVTRDDRLVPALNQPVAYFVPQDVADPTLREPGEELWVEVSVPRRGAPRPIRLGVKKGGVLTPLEIR